MSPESVTYLLHEPLLPLVVLAGLSLIVLAAGYAYAVGYDHGHARGIATVRTALGFGERPRAIQALRNAGRQQ